MLQISNYGIRVLYRGPKFHDVHLKCAYLSEVDVGYYIRIEIQHNDVRRMWRP